jgi:hypothetical protein
MATNERNVVLSLDQVFSGASDENQKTLSEDQVFQFADYSKDSEVFLSESEIFDRYDPADPDTLYSSMRANPQRQYTDEQIDAYIKKSIEMGVSPAEIFDAAMGSAYGVVSQVAGGVYELLKDGVNLFNPLTEEGFGEKAGNLAASGIEGVGRGYYEMGALGASYGFANATSETKNIVRADGFVDPGKVQRLPYDEYTETQKQTAREAFRRSSSALAQMQRYAEGRDSVIGDVGLGLYSLFSKDYDKMTPEEKLEAEKQVNEFYAASDFVRAAVNPKIADLASMIAGPEGVASRLANKATTKAAQGVAEKSLGAVGKVGKTSDEIADASQDLATDLKDAPVVGSVVDEAGKLKKLINRVSDFSRGLKSEVGKEGDENVFLRMARNRELENPKNVKLAEFLGHGMFTMKGPVSQHVSATARMLAKPANIVVQGGKSAVGGAAGGMILALPTQDSEMIGQQLASSAALALGQGMASEAVFANRNKIDAAANNWLMRQSPEIQAKFAQKDFTQNDIARFAVFERFAQKLIEGTTGDVDVNFVYTDANSFVPMLDMLQNEGLSDAIGLDQVTDLSEKILQNSAGDKIPSYTRGVQFLNTRNGNGKPIALINVDAMTPTTIIHEGIHALSRLDVLQDYVREINSVLFDTPPVGDVGDVKPGIVSDAALDKMYSAYMDRIKDKGVRARLEKYDTDLAAYYPQGTAEANPNYWRRARMKDEVVADVFETFLFNKDPLYVTRTDLNANAFGLGRPMGRVMNMVAQFFSKTSDPEMTSVQNLKNETGVRLKYNDPGLESAINSFINFQQKLNLDAEGKMIRGEVEESESGVVVNTSEISKTAAEQKNYMIIKHDDQGNVQYDAKGNVQIEENAKALKAKERKRKKISRQAFQDQEYKPDRKMGNKQPMNFTPDSPGSDKGRIEGDYISDAAMEKFRNAPRYLFPPSLLAVLESANNAIKSGEVINIDYNARLVPKGRTGAVYSSKIGSSLRTSIPFGFYMSQAGNILLQTVDLTHLNEKYARIMSDPRRRGAILRYWKDDANPSAANTRAAFDASLIKYINNTTNPGVGGLADGLHPNRKRAEQMRNVLSAFMGFTKKDIDFTNNSQRQRALLDHLNPERQDNLIRSRRIDAINAIEPTSLPKMPLSRKGRKLIQENYDPGKADELYMEAADKLDDSAASALVKEAAAANGYTLTAYHGTRRIDRIGNEFLKGRATSGPMAFFTSDPAIAKNYSTSKADTSIREIPDYVDQFKVRLAGKNYPIATMYREIWPQLAEKLSKVAMDDDGNIVMGDGTGGDWSYYMRSNGNNPFKAAADVWLNSGYLYGEEGRFVEVLKAAGIKRDIIFDDPYAEKPGVVPAYIRMANPVDVTKLSDADYQYLLKSVKGKRAKPSKGGADQWDKNDISGADFAERLQNDRADGTTWAWTAIPDYVTQALIERGYDGIIDTGGKGGGQSHSVYIPFYPSQIKSAQTVTRDKRGNIVPLSQRFDQSTADIRYEPGDLDYVRAVNSGNNKKARAMLKKAAKDRGYPVVVHHGSPDVRGLRAENRFRTRQEVATGERGDEEAYFFTDDPKTAKSYADTKTAWDYQNSVKGVQQFYLDLGNTKVIDGKGERWRYMTQQSVAEAKREGYDSYTVENVKDEYMPGDRASTVYAVFKPEQIKSAALVTRDEFGNVIPLSRRFSSGTADLRYEPGINTSIEKGFWYNETDVQGTKPTSAQEAQAIRWQQVTQELDRRKSSGTDGQSVEALVFGGRSYDSSWVAPVTNKGEAIAKMDAQDQHLLDWSKDNGYYIPVEDFQYAMSVSLKAYKGEEHRVILTPDGNHVIKVTHKDQYGKPFKLPSEYLQQMDDYNDVVSPDMQRTFLGITEFKPGVPAIVTAQPVVTGTKITDEQIGGYMEKEGFTQLGSLYVYQHESGVRIHDLHDGNAVIGEDGKIKPFDVWVDIPRGEELQKRFKPVRSMDDGKATIYRNAEGYRAIEDEDGSVRLYEPSGAELDKLFSNIIEAESHLIQAA